MTSKEVFGPPYVSREEAGGRARPLGPLLV